MQPGEQFMREGKRWSVVNESRSDGKVGIFRVGTLESEAEIVDADFVPANLPPVVAPVKEYVAPEAPTADEHGFYPSFVRSDTARY